MRVKVCGMNDPENVLDINVARPDYLGFIFYPESKRYVGGHPDKSLFSNVKPPIMRVGVFVNETTEKICELADMASLDLIQLHGDESPGYCNDLKSTGLKIIKVFHIGYDFDFELLKPYLRYCDYFLFDTYSVEYGGTGKKFNWDKLKDYNLNMPFFLSGGIGLQDTEVLTSLEHPDLFAVDINSRFEIVPGKKNIPEVKLFIDNIKTKNHGL